MHFKEINWLVFGVFINLPGDPQKVLLLKIHNTKTTSWIRIIQILVKSRKQNITTNIGKFNFTEISWLKNDYKMAQNIDQFINDFSQRIMKKMQLLMGERHPLYIN